jgi:hypothetical protein
VPHSSDTLGSSNPFRQDSPELSPALAAGPRRQFAAGFELGQRFVLTRSLGSGGMGQVFAAHDRVRQIEVAVKLLGGWTPRSIGDLKREFRAAAELVHPNLVRLHELCCDGPEWYFSMDLVEGVQLQTLLARGSSPSLLRHVFRQLAAGLRALHRAGTLHTDLKPSNFLITAPNNDVVLLDFGLARPIGLSEGIAGVGTPAYMAPEQALGEPLTEATDWYSFGVVLYEALTGSLPLWRPAADRLAGAPEDLRRLCLDILVLNPGARPSGDEVLRRIGESSSGGVLSSLAATRGRSLVGRRPEQSLLEAALQASLRGSPALALIEGPSGIGKTALVQHCLDKFEERRAFVLAGACRERESMSYKAVDGLVDGLVALLDSFPRAEADALLPAGIGDLTVLFPALRAARSVAAVPEVALNTADQGQIRLRAIACFRELMLRLRKLRPVVLAIDDLQWSDEESALLLAPLFAPPEPVPLLFIGTTRGSRDDIGPLVTALAEELGDALPEPVEIRLGPLDPSDAEHLALGILSRAGEASAETARAIGREGDGHPLFIAELAHAATDSQAPEAPKSFAALIAHRVGALPREAASLLGVVAISGTAVPRRVLRLAVGMSASEADHAFDVLKASRLVRSRGLRDEHLVESHHDRIREIVVQSFSEPERRRCHLSLARALETWSDSKPELVALHYESGGELESAGRHWILAADQAARALAFSHAAELYARGMAQESLTTIERRALEVRRAEALAHAGNGPAAADGYLAAAATAAQGEALDLKRRAAEQLLLSGHLDRGLLVMEQVLASVGIRKQLTGRPSVVSVLVSRTRLKLRGLEHTPRTENEISHEELARIDACWTLAWSLAVIDPVLGADFQATHLRLALNAGEERRILRALTLEASYTSSAGVGAARHTLRVLRLADALAREASTPLAAALLRVAHGVTAYLEGRLATAVDELGVALGLLARDCPGAVWETVTAHRFTIASLFWLGRLKTLRAVVPPLLAEADGTGNLYATMCFRTAYAWAAWLASDDVREATSQMERASSEWQATGYQLSHCNVLIARSYIDLYAGAAERAYSRLLAEWPKVEASHYLRIGVLRAQLWKLRAAAALVAADALQARGEAARAAALRDDARIHVNRLRAEPLRRAVAFAAGIDAALARAAGDVASARRHLAEAAMLFDAQQMALFAAAARAHLGRLVGGSEGAELVDAARAVFAAEEVAEPAKMMRMLVPGFG